MGRLHSHDLRRGAARDTANLQSKSKGIANETATTVLGHNLSASNRPLTAHYVGAHDDDIWTKRINEKYMDSISTTPEAENSCQRRFQKLKAKEVTDKCISEGLDSNTHKDRARASKLLGKGRQADWADQENRKWQMLNTHSPEASLAPVTLGIGAPQVLKVTPTNVTTTAIKASEDCPTISTVTTNDIPMDPQLSEHARNLCNVMVGAADGSTDTQIEGLLLDSVQGTICLPISLTYTTHWALCVGSRPSTPVATRFCRHGVTRSAILRSRRHSLASRAIAATMSRASFMHARTMCTAAPLDTDSAWKSIAMRRSVTSHRAPYSRTSLGKRQPKHLHAQKKAVSSASILSGSAIATSRIYTDGQSRVLKNARDPSARVVSSTHIWTRTVRLRQQGAWCSDAHAKRSLPDRTGTKRTSRRYTSCLAMALIRTCRTRRGPNLCRLHVKWRGVPARPSLARLIDISIT
jgi:hypothetical protein